METVLNVIGAVNCLIVGAYWVAQNSKCTSISGKVLAFLGLFCIVGGMVLGGLESVLLTRLGILAMFSFLVLKMRKKTSIFDF